MRRRRRTKYPRDPHPRPGSRQPQTGAPRASVGEFLLFRLYEEHAPALQRYVATLTGGDTHWAEDVVQETLLRAWRHAEQLAERSGGDGGEGREGYEGRAASPRSWLATVARRIVIDDYRSRLVRPQEVGDKALEFIAGPDELDRALSAITLWKALATLKPAQREAIVESYLVGRTVRQAAAVLGIPCGTVKSRVHYGLLALRRTLDGPL